MRRIRRHDPNDAAGAAVVLTGVAILLTFAAAWVRHAFWTIGLLMSDAPLTAGKALLAVGGVFFPPVGVLHGFWLWFN